MMPARITAVGFVGKTHPIETEDEVSAILEYRGGGGQGNIESGAIGHFITSTGEAPGSNRLEIAGSRGRIVAENGRLTFWQTKVDSRDFLRTCAEPFGAPACTETPISIPVEKRAEHQVIMQDFIDAIRNDMGSERLIAPAVEGVYAVELSNALQMAALTRRTVELPLDAEAYEAFMEERSNCATGEGKAMDFQG